MSRTIKKVKLTGKNPEDVQKFIDGWLEENGFEVKEMKSDGKPISVKKWFSWYGVRISPRIGSTVAIKYDAGGCIVFEITLSKDGGDTLLHGEFYAAGAESFRGREYDLISEPEFTAKIPRKAGYEAMNKLLQALQVI